MPRSRPLLKSVSPWLPALSALLAIVLILAYNGADLGSMARFAVYLAVIIALPGIFVWRWLLSGLHRDDGTGPTWFEDASLGSIFGFGLQLPLYMIGVWIGLPLIYLILPVVVIAASLTRWGRAIWTLPTGGSDVRMTWTLSGLVIYATAWMGHYAFTPVPAGLQPAETLTVDGTFHLALITELEHRVWPQIPFMLDTRLDYHWFVHAQLAANHWLTGINSVTMLKQLMPAAMIALSIAGLGAVAQRLTGRPLAAAVAPVLLVVGAFSLVRPHYDLGQFIEPYLSRRYISSPSQAYGFMMALPGVMLVLEVLRPDRRASRGVWIALVLALLALSGSKATFMPIFLCGSVGLWFLTLVSRRRIDMVTTWLVVVMAVVTAFAQFVLLGGSSGGMMWGPAKSIELALHEQGIAVTPATGLAMALTMLFGWLLYGAGAIGLLRDSVWRDPRALWMLICIPVGVLIPFLFYRSGLGQFWFQRSIAPLVVLVSAWGLAQLLPKPMPTRLAIRLVAVAAGAGLGAFAISTYLGRHVENQDKASLREIVATAIAPFVIVAIFALAMFIAKRARAWTAASTAFLLAVLLGLPLSHIYGLARDIVKDEPQTEAAAPLFPEGAIAAGSWVSKHSDPYDVVATNVHCRGPVPPASQKCDNRSFWVAALTERRVLIEGWGYTSETNADDPIGPRNARVPASKAERLAINDAAFNDPSEETVGRLIDDYGVKFLFVDKRYPVDMAGLTALDDLLEKRFENQSMAVFKVKDP